MALKISLILTGISIALLVIYGADVAAAQGDGQGFLPFDHKTRGMGLGGPSIILPIIAFFISRKESSKPLGAMIIVSGILIIIGGITVLALANPAELEQTGRNVMSESAPLLVIGAVIVALGAIKLRR
jgi:heme A synthase